MWFLFALTFALTTSLIVAIAKRVTRETDEYFFLSISGLFTLPVLYFIATYSYGIPRFDTTFLGATFISVVLSVIAAVAAYRAIKIEEISLVGPLSAFNPVFTSVIAFFTLGERIGMRGVVGVLLVSAGAYLLQLSTSKKGLAEPIKKMATNKAVQLSLFAYFLWAITPVFQKTAILHTNPQNPPFASLVGLAGAVAIYSLFMGKYTEKPLYYTKRFFPLLIVAGVIAGIGQAAAFLSFSLTNLGFATAVFKLSIVFSVLLGWLFFKERNIRDRILGASVMLVGVILLTT